MPAFLRCLPNIPSVAALIKSFKAVSQITRTHDISSAIGASWTALALGQDAPNVGQDVLLTGGGARDPIT